MAELRWTKEAEQWLQDIHEYIARDNPAAGKLLKIESLDDLKDRLGKVILMILIVAFFKNVLYVKFDDPLNILYMGGGIFLVSLSLYFGHKAGQKGKAEHKAK